MSLPQFFLRAAKAIRLLPAESMAIRESLRNAVRKSENSRLDITMKEQEFIERAQSIALSASEKAVMKEAILDAMKKSHGQAWWFLPFKSFASITAAVLIVTVSGVSVSFAAEAAMPGDLLYSVKVHVNEEVKSRLAFTPMAKAQVESERVERRLKEAEILASTSSFTPEKAKMISDNLRANVAALQATTNDLEETDADAAVSLGMDIEATLAAHARLLSRLKTEQKSIVSDFITSLDDARMDIEEINISTIARANSANIVAALNTKIHSQQKHKESDESAGTAVMMMAPAMMKLDAHDAEEELREARIQLRRAKEMQLMSNHSSEAFAYDSSSSDGNANTTRVMLMTAPVETQARMTSSNSSESGAVDTYENDEEKKEETTESKEDKNFSAKVRVRMTEKKLEKVERTIRERRDQLKDDIVMPSESRMKGSKELMDMVKVKMDEGDADAALDASKEALRHIDEADEELEKVLQGL